MAAAHRERRSEGGPTVRRILLGAELRKLREAAGITREAAGYCIRASNSKISRMELGRVGFKERDVADLLTMYGVTDEGERAALLSLARDANTPGWWEQYGNLLPNWFQPYVGLEAAAVLIRTYEVQFVPGLLQTRDYARAVITLEHATASAAEIDRRVSLRMDRQQLLTRSDPPRLWAVVDEAALWRPIGGADIMRDQLTALMETTELPNLTLQVLPFRTGGHAASGGSFTILRFSRRDLPDVVYHEHLTSALYLDKREHIDHYAEAMERLAVQANPPTQTPLTLAEILKTTYE